MEKHDNEDEQTAVHHDVEVAVGAPASAPNPISSSSSSSSSSAASAPLFSIFTSREKWALVTMVGFAGFYSPMTANIYFPAIPLLAQDFKTSISLMNLTVTVYLVFQGLSPIVWGPLADAKGRRPVYLGCLALLCITCVALALIPTDKWYLLLIFRCLQASGSASTAALGPGVISDIATPAERGGFSGIAAIGSLIGPCIGPVIGGLLAGRLGWRWIFWFLCILSGAGFVFILLFLPETLRRIVGNGSIIAPWWDRPLIPVIGPYTKREMASSAPTPASLVPPQSSAKHDSNPFVFFREPDVVLVLLSNGLIYALFASVQASTSLLLQHSYPSLTQTTIGLCFLPMGAGAMAGAIISGKSLDWQYKKDRAAWEVDMRRIRGAKSDSKVPVDTPWSKEEEVTFPSEKARLKWAMVYTVSAAVGTIAYGWTLDKYTPLAVPLIFQFIIGFVVVGQINSSQTLLIDAFPKKGSSTTAINNFVRCLLGGGVTAIINIILDALGTGWTYVLLSGICLLLTPMFTLVVLRMGPRWRMARLKRTEGAER